MKPKILFLRLNNALEVRKLEITGDVAVKAVFVVCGDFGYDVVGWGVYGFLNVLRRFKRWVKTEKSDVVSDSVFA